MVKSLSGIALIVFGAVSINTIESADRHLGEDPDSGYRWSGSARRLLRLHHRSCGSCRDPGTKRFGARRAKGDLMPTVMPADQVLWLRS